MIIPDASTTPAWASLREASGRSTGISLSELFARDTHRTAWACVEAEGLVLDFTRQRIERETLGILCALADEVRLRDRISSMYRGDLINTTERRAVLHTALRRPQAPFAAEVEQAREQMLQFAEAVREGAVVGSTGRRFDLVVNIGIGGSDLGPAMAVEALRQYSVASPRVAFVSNVDGCRLADVLQAADPERTLFIICSKTFTTVETLTNAASARDWLRRALGAGAVPAHFAAVSVNSAAMDAFGVNPAFRFPMWDWVGGRYSIWSAVGVSLAIAIGKTHFLSFLAGGAAIDEHFLSAPWERNLPALMGLLGIWNINFQKLPTLAVLPYDDRLSRFPAYLQQLEMESNGKSVRMDGSPTFCETAPIIWGEPGNNAQHSFFQMLHQGTPRAALDFLLPARSSCGDQPAQELAIANCLAQVEAFAWGQPAAMIDGGADLVPHRVHEGGRPSSVLMFGTLAPRLLGSLVALYEHKVFTQSVIWGINAFDQWGVELGKRLAQGIGTPSAGGQSQGSPSLSLDLAKLRELMK